MQLQTDTPDPGQAQQVGQRLARLNCSYPEALPLTIATFNVHFFQDIPPADAELLGKRVAALIGYISTGYFQLLADNDFEIQPAENDGDPGPFSLTLAHLSRVRLENLKRMQVIELEMVNNQLRQELAERRYAEKSLRHYNQELSKVTLAGQNLSSVLDVEQVLKAILAELHRLIKVFAYSVWLLDPESGDLVCQQATEAHRQTIIGWHLKPDMGIVGWVVTNNQSVLVNDSRQDPRHYKQIDTALNIEMRSILSVPLNGRYGVIGALQIVDIVPNRFKPSDQVLLETLARSAGVAIENATLYEQTRRDADVKTLLLREVNQRVADNLASINSILNLKRNRVQSTNLLDYQAITEDVINQVQSLTTVYSMMSASPASTILLSELTSRVINASLKVLSPQKYVSVNVEPSTVQLNSGQAHEMALIINELVTNAVKHALPHVSSALEISVSVNENQPGSNSVRLTFEDNGPGYPAHILGATTYHNCLGLELLQQVVYNSLNGRMNLLNDPGAKAIIEFKQSNSDNSAA